MSAQIEVLPQLRWKAVAVYQTVNGVDVIRSWMFDEIGDLHDAIEAGPNFCAIKSITITYNGGPDYRLGEEPGDMDNQYRAADVVEFPR